MNLEDMVLSEISQPQMGRHCMIPLRGGTLSSAVQRQKVDGWLPGTGEGGWGVSA